jgi:hypothetical protein
VEKRKFVAQNDVQKISDWVYAEDPVMPFWIVRVEL